MTYLFCSSDPYLLARWRGTGVKATECSPSTLASVSQDADPGICLLDTGGMRDDQAQDFIAAFPNLKFVIATQSPDPVQGVHMLRAGAGGYLNRLANGDVLRTALQSVAKGSIWAGEDTINFLLRQQTEPTIPTENLAQVLTERELEIALLVLEGMSNKGIADRLNITERTVKTHLNAAFGKTCCKTRLQLALWLGRQGYEPSSLQA